MAMAINIDFVNREVFMGGPGTQWWKQMASAIAGGLIFATLLTLVLTPSLLMIQATIAQRIKQRRLLKSGPAQTRPETPIQQS
jgi:multidrug efflux pump